MPISRNRDPLSLKALYRAVVAHTRSTQEDLIEASDLGRYVVQTIASGHKNVRPATANAFIKHVEEKVFPSEWPEFIESHRQQFLNVKGQSTVIFADYLTLHVDLWDAYAFKMEATHDYISAAGALNLLAWAAQSKKDGEKAAKLYLNAQKILTTALDRTVVNNADHINTLLANVSLSSLSNTWNLIPEDRRAHKILNDKLFRNQLENCLEYAKHLISRPAYKFDVSVLRNGLLLSSVLNDEKSAITFYARLADICGPEVWEIIICHGARPLNQDPDFMWLQTRRNELDQQPEVREVLDAYSTPIIHRRLRTQNQIAY